MAGKLITVRSTIPTKADGGNIVALYEVHPDHPDGEAYVAGPKPVRVARTSDVQKAISDEKLEIVDDEPEPTPAPAQVATPAAPAPVAVTTTSSTGNVFDTPGLLTEGQRKALADAGINTADDVRKVSDDDLKSVEGIGPATIIRLREATKE